MKHKENAKYNHIKENKKFTLQMVPLLRQHQELVWFLVGHLAACHVKTVEGDEGRP